MAPFISKKTNESMIWSEPFVFRIWDWLNFDSQMKRSWEMLNVL